MKMIEIFEEELSEMDVALDGELTEETNLTTDLSLEDLDVMDFIARLENRYDISISDATVEMCNTIGDIMEVIKKKFQ